MAQMQEVKMLVGGMDRENSPETMNLYDYIEAHNIRTIGNDESDSNYLSNLEGTKIITVNLPIGQNRAIGANSFETVSKAYFVRYNSMGYHQVVEFDYDSLTEDVIFENLTDSDGVDILGLSANSYFTDIRLLHSRFLILNNGESEIYCLDVEKFKKGGVYTEEDLYLIKRQPLKPSEVEYVNNTTKSTNNVRGSLFQFRYQYKYDDFRESSWSTVSKRLVPINEQSNGQGQSVAIANAMIVSVIVDPEEILELNIATREGTSNWLLVKTVTKEHLLALASVPATAVPIPHNPTTGNLTSSTVTESYDPTTGIYEFLFYNEGLYPVIDQIEVENPYDSVPQKAETVEGINGNLLAVGGFTEGYERPILDSVEVISSQYAPNLANNVTGGTDFDFSHIMTQNNVYAEFWFKGSPKEGDVVHFKVKPKSGVTWEEYTYSVTSVNEAAGLNATVGSIYNAFRNIVPLLFAGRTGAYIYTNASGSSFFAFDVEFYVVRQDIGVLNTQSINTLKSNSSYQLALAYFDRFGRYFPIVTDDRFIVDTKAITETQGNLSQINWTIQENAPDGAVSYQWLLSENQKYQNSIYLTANLDTGETSENYIGLEVKSLERFYNNEKDSQINYSFTKGDKVVMMYTTNGANSDVVDWLRYPFIELDIVDFTIEEDPVVVGNLKYILKVRRTDLLNRSNGLTWLEGKDIMLEIYTPKRRNIDTETILFYEIGEQYDIVDGKHSVLSGAIREGDWYYKGRLYESTITDNVAIAYEVEDPNFSDNYASRYWSAGRARTYNDEQGRVEKKASIRYSDEYQYGNNYNGLSRFYLERIYGEQGGQTTSKYGWIRKLESRDNGLVCIQEFKVGIIPVYKAIIYDNADASLVADSGKIFGSVQYRVGNYGCGDAKESVCVSRNSLIYFFDDNNCLPLRDSYSGLDVIDINMTSYFIKYAKIAKSKGARFIGYYDNANQEYNLTIEDVSGRLVTLTFEAGMVVYQDNVPTSFNVLQPEHGTVTIDGFNVTYTPDEDYVGSDRIPIEVNGGLKGVNVSVEMGDAVPSPFDFVNKVNQQLVTLIESDATIVGGINMPTPISIVGGEYNVNGGAWVTTAGEVVNGDVITLRVLTSGDFETPVTATLTIGGVDGSFTVTTIPADVTPSEFLDVVGTIQSSGDGYGVRLTISHALTSAYSISGIINYTKFGSNQVTPVFVLTIPAGLTEIIVNDLVHFPEYINNGRFILGTSQPFADGEVVLCADTVQRVANITPYMFTPII